MVMNWYAEGVWKVKWGAVRNKMGQDVDTGGVQYWKHHNQPANKGQLKCKNVN